MKTIKVTSFKKGDIVIRDSSYVDYNEFLNMKNYYDSGIKQLLDIIEKPKTCFGCKHLKPNMFDVLRCYHKQYNECSRLYPEQPDLYEKDE